MKPTKVSQANTSSAETSLCNRALDEESAAVYTNVSVSTLRKGRMDGQRDNHMPPPPYVRLGRRVVYLLDDLDRWLEANRVTAPPSSSLEGPK
jgi:hypothetical protein